MATTYYASVVSTATTLADCNSGTSSTAADIIELRMGNGTYSPDRAEVVKALELFRRWIEQGGTKGAGANLPLPTGNN